MGLEWLKTLSKIFTVSTEDNLKATQLLIKLHLKYYDFIKNEFLFTYLG